MIVFFTFISIFTTLDFLIPFFMLQDKVVVAINQPSAQSSSISGKICITNSIKEAVKWSSFFRWYHENKFSNYDDDCCCYYYYPGCIIFDILYLLSLSDKAWDAGLFFLNERFSDLMTVICSVWVW